MAVRIIFLMSVLSIPGMSQRWIGRVGLTYSRIFYDMEQNYGIPGVGIQLGKEIPLSKAWYFQPDIGLTTKGSVFRNAAYASDRSFLALLYFDCTLPFKVFLIPEKRIYFLFGPQVSIGLVGYYGNNSSTPNSWVRFRQFESNRENLYYHFVDHRLDVGFQIGGGVELKKFILDFRYTQGLRKIYDGATRAKYDYSNNQITTAVHGVFQASIAKPLNWGKSAKD